MDITDNYKSELGVKGQNGAFASQVFIDSPAYKAGMQAGDFIVELNGKTIKSQSELVREVGYLTAGKDAAFKVIRGGKTLTLNVKIEERGKDAGNDNAKLWPGFIASPLTDELRKELEIKSSFDPLTMLLSRGYFFSAAEEIVRLVRGENMYLCLLDLDGFKGINDTLGHQMGDKVIQTVGKVILRLFDLEKNGQCVSEWDLTRNIPIAGRLGGDEFIILLRMESPKQTENKMRELMNRLSEVKFDGLDGIRTSVGVTEITGDDRDLDAAYKRADDALYESKRAGKNQITIG